MNHSFDIDIAKEYGILEAVILDNVAHWIKHNEANETNYHDGTYWTYNSTRAFTKIFPYASQRQIQTALKKLIENGLLKTGNYNKSAYDRTLWYALTEKGKTILHYGKMETTENVNGITPDVKPIPTINTNTNTTINTYKKVVDLYNETCVSFPKVTTLSDRRKKSIHARLTTYTLEDFKKCFAMAEQSDFLKGKNNRDWQANFDWMIKDANMAKILDGNYTNKTSYTSAKQDNQKYCMRESKPDDMKPVDYRDFLHDGKFDKDAYNAACAKYKAWADSTRK